MDKKTQAPYKIVDGPSREKLFDGLRLRHENRKITFTIKFSPDVDTRKHPVAFLLDSINIEDGSGNNWLLTLSDPLNIFGNRKLEAYFNTSTRKGWIKPREQKAVAVVF